MTIETRTYKIKITEPELINNLEQIYKILNNEYQMILNDKTIQINSFSETAYHPKFKTRFVQELSKLTNKRYLTWDYNNKATYFYIVAHQICNNFKSLKEKIQIAQICEKYNWDWNENNTNIRNELLENNLYPTFAYIKNICRNKLIPSKQNEINLTLNYASGNNQIVKSTGQEPVYQINFNGKWQTVNLPMYEKLNQSLSRKKIKITKYCKPNFFKKDNVWWAAISYQFKVEKIKNNGRILGIDLGQVKPISSSIVYHNQVIGRELLASKQAIHLNHKMIRLQNNLHFIYSKLKNYLNILKSNHDKDISNKNARLLKEKLLVKNKISRLKLAKAQLIAYDVMKITKKFNVTEVHMERLNFVENTGGKWDFSQQQDWIDLKLRKMGIKLIKVNAAYTSHKNPFSQKHELGTYNSQTRKQHFDTFVIDRDRLASINIAKATKLNSNKQLIWSTNINSNAEYIKN